MQAVAVTAPTYRYVGVTDERVECDNCGRTELRSTVVLATLDADGNDAGVVYYGSSCAAHALKVRGGARKVLDNAQAAQRRVERDYRRSLTVLAYLGVDLRGRFIAGRPAFAMRRFGQTLSTLKRDSLQRTPGALRAALDMYVAEHVAVVADARLLGLLD